MAFGFEYVHWIEENMKTNCSTFLFNKGTYIYIYIWVKLLVVLVAQSCLTLCDRMDCSLPGSSVHGILPRILEWVAIPISRGSSQSRGWTWVSCLAGRFFSIWATRGASYYICICLYTLDWLKSLSGFSLRCYGKTWRNFLANLVCC